MKRKLAIKGCVVTLALLLLRSTSMAFTKDLSDLRYYNSDTSMSFVNVISWHAFSSMANDPEEVDKDING